MKVCGHSRIQIRQAAEHRQVSHLDVQARWVDSDSGRTRGLNQKPYLSAQFVVKNPNSNRMEKRDVNPRPRVQKSLSVLQAGG